MASNLDQYEIVIEDEAPVPVYAKIALAGPSGSGKSYSALKIADPIANGGLIIVIDTQNRQSDKLKLIPGLPKFRSIHLKEHSPEHFLAAIRACMRAQAKVIIIDSLTHEHNGNGGLLDIVSKHTNKFQSGWGEASPRHARFIAGLIGSPIPIIATLRAKTEYAVEVVENKTKIRELGIEPIQREGTVYEFDMWGMLDRDHNLEIRKSVIADLPQGTVISCPDENTGLFIAEWSMTHAALAKGA